MFSRVRNFLSRHKRKFVISGIIIGGGVLALRYAQRKFLEFQQAQAREFLEKTRRTQHFESTERTCNQAIMGLASGLCEEILRILNTETILEQLRKNPDNKMAFWDELKVLSFTRLTALVYASSMLVVTLRIQLNLLGGYLYKDSTTTTAKITNDVQQMYLSLVQHLLKDGLKDLCTLIEEKVRRILKDYDLKRPLKLSDTEQIFWSIQMAVNSANEDPNSALAKYVFPSDIHGNDLLNKLVAETLDLLESDEVAVLCSNNVTRGFSIVVDNIAEFFSDPISKNGIVANATNEPSTSKSNLNAIFNINTAEMPLAKLIPVINGLAAKTFNSNGKPPSLSTSLVTLYMVSDKVKMLGANVYEVFSQ